MMRIIDADEIIKEQRKNMELLYGKIGAELNKHMDIDDDKSIYIHSMETYSRAKQFYHGLKGILENAQTVDAVPVVRCKDCKWSKPDIILNKRWCCRFSGRMEILEDDFCSYGRRAENSSL